MASSSGKLWQGPVVLYIKQDQWGVLCGMLVWNSICISEQMIPYWRYLACIYLEEMCPKDIDVVLLSKEVSSKSLLSSKQTVTNLG